MSDQRPGITFNAEGVCRPCQVAEERKSIDWDARWKELVELCDKHRKSDGSYDSIITVSGGKDSHYQVYVMKELLGMHPLLLNIANYSNTETGRRNFENLGDAFNCDILSFNIRRKAARLFTRIAFERLGSPTLAWDRAVYAWPISMAFKLNIPLIVYGENISYEYGGSQGETPWAYEQINNEATRPLNPDEWISRSGGALTLHDFEFMKYPDPEMVKGILKPIYLSYFVKWDGKRNYELAKRWGFHHLGHEHKREGYIEDYDQIDTLGYLVHPWLKYPKYGHARATDVSCYWIRNGYITRDEGIEFVKAHDHELDQAVLDDFLAWTGYSHGEFWAIVDKFYNPELFEKVNGQWRLKHPIWAPGS
jgi:N-acetyl sugar amidotransferase